MLTRYTAKARQSKDKALGFKVKAKNFSHKAKA